MDLFMIATRSKFRFPYTKGNVSTEDLWDLDVEDLNEIYKTLSGQKTTSDSLIPNADTDANAEINAKMLVVRTIYDQKEAERQAAVAESANRVKKQKILEILAEKEDGSLRDKSTEELQKMLDELG